ncbi:hypothetical protein EVAR_75437_1 [Eumeta japonica]|uniref:Uncharacterized protein n=1 Tax=Eumeta variegata TaxID=151549 RepID=A0A4C1TJZ9_EUMVA|nr:hypothetical protein EVAR_75437_1 [Eumeta japonica]
MPARGGRELPRELPRDTSPPEEFVPVVPEGAAPGARGVFTPSSGSQVVISSLSTPLDNLSIRGVIDSTSDVAYLLPLRLADFVSYVGYSSSSAEVLVSDIISQRNR